ncbi:phosphatidylglycerophosphatase A family protein [Oceanobacter mangrovi]|uniref:phosphatidylglycerophosphatase A family protein n=1 Tax=Oceanobacter mangrovi TaxID=2862510 RepID=UPI001C8EFBE8|nr:phosphatidylglycerophosphatase A [Oceanobacter mangrovi]
MAAAQLTSWQHWLAFGLGSGLARKAPGTWGTLAAIPVWWLALQHLPLLPYLLMLLLTSLVGIYLCGKTADDLGVHDHPGIVWDEWVGIWITCLLLPDGWYWIVAAFAAFRFFDILKPWPIRWLDQHVEGGLGIMIDDILAGIMALIVVQLAAFWLV